MCASRGTDVVTPLNPDRLERFKCVDARRYPVDGKWLTKPDQYGKRHVDLKKILTTSDNYECFVSSTLTLAADSLSNDPRLAEEYVQLLQKPFEELHAQAYRTADHEISGNEYHFSDGLGVLAKDGSLNVPDETRVVFTPSKGRHDGGLLHWKEHRGEGDDDDGIRILLVPPAEHEQYRKAWGKRWLIVSTPCVHETVGAARHQILTLARHWKLPRIWMVDDSVPNTEFYITSLATISRSAPYVESVTPDIARISHREAFPEAEAFREERSLTLLGFTSGRSVESALKAKAGHADKSANGELTDPAMESLKVLTSPWNDRAPTSCVLVDVAGVPEDISYDERLPYKEDIVFTARLIAAGRNVCVLRDMHVKDVWMSTGGCSPPLGLPTEYWSSLF